MKKQTIELTHVVIGSFYTEFEGDNDFIGSYDDCVEYLENCHESGFSIITIEQYESPEFNK